MVYLSNFAWVYAPEGVGGYFPYLDSTAYFPSVTSADSGYYYFQIESASCYDYEDSVYVSVIAVPGPITGLSHVCQFSAITLSDSISGGTWSSYNTSIATVDGSGNVTGINPGTDTVYYSLISACAGSVQKMVVTVDASGAVSTASVSGLCWCGLLYFYRHSGRWHLEYQPADYCVY